MLYILTFYLHTRLFTPLLTLYDCAQMEGSLLSITNILYPVPITKSVA